jgi:hypothetical protein
VVVVIMPMVVTMGVPPWLLDWTWFTPVQTIRHVRRQAEHLLWPALHALASMRATSSAGTM